MLYFSPCHEHLSRRVPHWQLPALISQLVLTPAEMGRSSPAEQHLVDSWNCYRIMLFTDRILSVLSFMFCSTLVPEITCRHSRCTFNIQNSLGTSWYFLFMRLNIGFVKTWSLWLLFSKGMARIVTPKLFACLLTPLEFQWLMRDAVPQMITTIGNRAIFFLVQMNKGLTVWEEGFVNSL